MIEKYNFHWREGFFYNFPEKRKLFDELVKEIKSKQIISLIGLRRTGKTTILKQLIDHLITSEKIEREHILFYSFDEEEVIEGQIIAISNGFSTSVPVHLNFLKDFIPVEEDFEEEFISETCSELNGLICGENQQCDGEIKYPIDGVCCIGICTEIQESFVGKIIGWAILIIVVILLVWFYFKRYKGTKRVSDLMKVLKRK